MELAGAGVSTLGTARRTLGEFGVGEGIIYGGEEKAAPGAPRLHFSLDVSLCVRLLPGPSRDLNPLTLSAGPQDQQDGGTGAG